VQPLPTIHSPLRNVRVVERTSSSLPLSSRQTRISASGTVDCNNNNYKGPEARTFTEVAARPPAPHRMGKEPTGAAGVKNNDRMKGRNADGRDARKTNMPCLPPPRCAAVALTVRNGSGFTYRNAMSVVRREIKLSDLGIAEMRPRRAITSALIFAIADQDASSKASQPAEKMAGALRDFPAKVTVPRKTAELRVTELEDSITPEEVAAAVAEAGGCQTAEVSVGVTCAVSSGPRLGVAALPADRGKENRRQQRRGRDAPGGNST
jgi:hypothetical protein